jgi:hypothetical protein
VDFDVSGSLALARGVDLEALLKVAVYFSLGQVELPCIERKSEESDGHRLYTKRSTVERMGQQ